MNYHITLKSTNAKTGPMPVITASRQTCPDACPLKKNLDTIGAAACYAESGPLALHWNNVTSGKNSATLDEVLEPIRKLPQGAIWRYGQAGDLPGVNNAIDIDGLMAIAKAGENKRTILYTHKPPMPANLAALRKARDEYGLHVNLSGNSPRHADMLAQHGFDVVTILPGEYGRKTKGKEWSETLSEYKTRTKALDHKTPEGRQIAVCPATYLDTNCAACGLCAKPERNGAIVGFPAHGTGNKKATATASTF